MFSCIAWVNPALFLNRLLQDDNITDEQHLSRVLLTFFATRMYTDEALCHGQTAVIVAGA